MPIVRKWFITDKDGNPVEITSQTVLQSVLDQMSPEEFALWKDRYRFVPIENNVVTIPSYVGTLRDLP